MSLHPLIWYALTTRPQGERAAVDALRDRRFDTYIPQETRLRRTAKGPKPVDTPLLPGLIFVGVKSWQELHPIYGIPSIVGIVSLCGKPHPIPGAFVYHLLACQASGDFDHTPRKVAYDKDEPVKVTAGPFQGHIGKIVQALPEDRVRVFFEGKFVKGDAILKVDQIERSMAA